MSEKIHNLTDSQLKEIIKLAVEEAVGTSSSVLTYKNLFNDVRIDDREIEIINNQFEITNVLEGVSRKRILTNISMPHGWGTSYTKVYNSDIHKNIKNIVLNVFGKTLNSELTRDEYIRARTLYAETRDWFLKAYEERLKEMNDRQKK